MYGTIKLIEENAYVIAPWELFEIVTNHILYVTCDRLATTSTPTDSVSIVTESKSLGPNLIQY